MHLQKPLFYLWLPHQHHPKSQRGDATPVTAKPPMFPARVQGCNTSTTGVTGGAEAGTRAVIRAWQEDHIFVSALVTSARVLVLSGKHLHDTTQS